MRDVGVSWTALGVHCGGHDRGQTPDLRARASNRITLTTRIGSWLPGGSTMSEDAQYSTNVLPGRPSNGGSFLSGVQKYSAQNPASPSSLSKDGAYVRKQETAAREQEPATSVRVSHCTECGAEMDACEASQYEECHECRSAKKVGHRVRDLNRMGTDLVGRQARSSALLGGSAEMPENRPAEDTDEQG